MGKNFKKNGVLSGAVIVALILLFCIFFLIRGTGNSDLKNHIDLGRKYMEDLQYEQALAEYKAALEIDPDNQDAMNGIETATLQYADSLLENPQQISVEEFENLINLLEESYQLTEINSIQVKMEEIKTTIKENEKKKQEAERLEETKKKEEERRKREEAEKRKQEQEEKKQREDYYLWKLNEIYGDRPYVVIQLISNSNGKFIFSISYGATVIERITVEMDEKTEIGVVTKHLEEDWENGGMKDVSEERSEVGNEYDMAITEEGKAEYQEYVIQQEEFERLLNEYAENVIEYINESWEEVLDGNVQYDEKHMNPYDATGTEWFENIDYVSLDGTIKYEFHVIINMEKKQAYIQEVYDNDYENISLPFETDINLGLNE